jgi:hypothetical protein
VIKVLVIFGCKLNPEIMPRKIIETDAAIPTASSLGVKIL